MSDQNIKVTAALIDQPICRACFGLRFDAHDRSIVISADAAPAG